MKRAYDAVVIGSGAGGGASAFALTRKGLRVLVLEAGPHYDPASDYKAARPDWEQSFPYKKNAQGKYTYDVTQPLLEKWSHLRSWNHVGGRLNPSSTRVSFGYHHVKAVGGSSLHFTGEAHRLNPHSMTMRSSHGVAADWPLTYQELEPYYVQAEQIVGVAGPSDDKTRPRSAPYPYEAHAPGYASNLLRKGFEQKGLRFIQNALAVLPEPRDNRLNCNFCGVCLKGCPRKDKGTIDVTYLAQAKASGLCEVSPGCSVTRVEADAVTGLVKGVHYYRDGAKKFISTPLLVLCGGAIETPRLLLASADKHSPDGLCNESGQVGKNFMETLLWTSNAFYPDAIGSHRGLPVDSICWDFNRPDSIPGVIGGCRLSPSVAESDLLGPVNYARRVVKGWGKEHKQKMRQSFGSVLSLSGLCESLPHAKSFIDLDPFAKDQNAIPVARIHSYIDDMAARRIEFMATKCREIVKASGATQIFEEFSSYDIFSSTHVFGTCRMGRDAKDSVTDADCRSFRWKNMYIVDASVFPSSGGGESPGLTIQALALRAMDSINPKQFL